MIYREPETHRFLTAISKLKETLRRKERQKRLARQRARAKLRKLRSFVPE